MMRTLAVLALLLVRPAIADTRLTVGGAAAERERAPVISVGTPTNARLDTSRVAVDGTRVRLTLVLATDEAGIHEASIPIMPGGARATELAISIDGERVSATAMEAADAHEAFRRVVDWRHDPALLEQTSADALRLTVWPLVATHPATIEITFERAGSARAVDRTTSLYAGFPVVIPTVTRRDRVVIDGPDSAVTRRVLDLAIPQLRRCFARPRGTTPTSATLRFTIERDGSVSGLSAGSFEASRCVRAAMNGWQLAKADRETTVFYTLSLRDPAP